MMPARARSSGDSSDIQRGHSQLDRRVHGGGIHRGTRRKRGSTPRRRSGFPFIVARDASGITGFGTFGEFRAPPCYQHSVEHSVHVRADRRGQGIGRQLVIELLARAAAMHKHVMIAGIDADNAVSIESAPEAWDSSMSGIFMKWDSNSGAGSIWCSCNVAFRRQRPRRRHRPRQLLHQM